MRVTIHECTGAELSLLHGRLRDLPGLNFGPCAGLRSPDQPKQPMQIECDRSDPTSLEELGRRVGDIRGLNIAISAPGDTRYGACASPE